VLVAAWPTRKPHSTTAVVAAVAARASNPASMVEAAMTDLTIEASSAPYHAAAGQLTNSWQVSRQGDSCLPVPPEHRPAQNSQQQLQGAAPAA